MWQGLVSSASRMLNDLSSSLQRGRAADKRQQPAATLKFKPLQRLLLTDGVGHTLFEEYAAHRASARGDEETGWLLLGLRETSEAIALATLPAGTQRSAGVAHVQFDSGGQALASRIVRQSDRRLMILGVVHTHPGSLRHPSDGDYKGDSNWINQLRSKEGVFGIGTADGMPASGTALARQPRQHMQCLGELCLSWYALRQGDSHYRPLPVGLTLGPDLARPLHPIWPTIEIHAERLDRLARQQNGVTFAVVPGQKVPMLSATVPLAEPGNAIRVLMDGEDVRYFVLRGEKLFEVSLREERVDQGVYLLLAELASHY
jgi:hypothetical protein